MLTQDEANRAIGDAIAKEFAIPPDQIRIEWVEDPASGDYFPHVELPQRASTIGLERERIAQRVRRAIKSALGTDKMSFPVVSLGNDEFAARMARRRG